MARTDYGGALQWRLADDGRIEQTSARATAVRYWHNRPLAGQARPSTDTPDDEESDQPPLEPLSGMP